MNTRQKFFLIGLIGIIALFGSYFTSVLNVKAQEAWCTPSTLSNEEDICPSIAGGMSVSGNTVKVSGAYFGGLSTNIPQCGTLTPDAPEGGYTEGFTWSTDDGLSGNVNYVATQAGGGGQCTGTNQAEEGTFSFNFTDNTPGTHTLNVTYFNSAFAPGDAVNQTFSYGNTVASADLTSDNIPATFNPSQIITTGTDGSPVAIVVKNTGNIPWDSDRSTLTSSVGDCDQATGVDYVCPDQSRGGGTSCTVSYNNYSDNVELSHVLGSFTASSNTVEYSQPTQYTCTLTTIASGCGQYGSCYGGNGGACGMGTCNVPTQLGGCGGQWVPSCINPYSYGVYAEASSGDPNVEPGATATFTLNSLAAPAAPGAYTETWQMESNGSTFPNPMPIVITVNGATSALPTSTPGAISTVSITSITPNPATNQITVVGTANSGQYPSGIDCPAPLKNGIGERQFAGRMVADGYQIDGGTGGTGSYALTQTVQGVNGSCATDAIPYQYTFSFTDNTDIASLASGSHAMTVCAGGWASDGNPGVACSTPTSFTVQAAAAPAILQLSTHSINLSGSGLNGQNIQVTNAGPATSQMSWSATPTVSWLSVGPDVNPVPVNGGTSQTVNIMANSAGLTPGVHLGFITFAATSTVDGKSLSSQNLTVSYDVAGAASAVATGTITVTSENAATNGPVNAAWDMTDLGSGPLPATDPSILNYDGDVCDWVGNELCHGSSQTYVNQPAANTATPSASYGSVTMLTNDITLYNPADSALYSFNSVRMTPIAQKKIGVIDALLSLTKSIFDSTAEAFVLQQPAMQTLTATQPVNYTILWNPIANIAVSSTNPLSLTSTQGSSTSGQVQISNTGAPGSTLTWTTTSDSSWLTATPSADASGLTNDNSGNDASEMVTINAASQPVGSYTGHITFYGTSAPGNPSNPLQFTLTVSYTVTPANPGNAVTSVTIVNCNPSSIDTTQTRTAPRA